jgi:hypothetical protein
MRAPSWACNRRQNATEVTLDANHAVWNLKVTQPISLTLKYDVEFDGDKLVGKVKMQRR